jgi:NAD(P)-dependent dehydrogenase (short-subunit alcohol dehydrogenase family)
MDRHRSVEEKRVSLIFRTRLVLSTFNIVQLINNPNDGEDLMKGKIVLITGATSGLGKETARALARLGATIVMTTRDTQKGEQTKQELIESTQNKNIDVMFCDLSSFVSIRTFCAEFLQKYHALHVLVNNAGVSNFHRKVSKDGTEETFAVNYLAPFLMTNLLLERLRQSAPSRIVNVVSGFHSGTIRFDDLEFTKDYSVFKVYGHSKVTLILFTRLLARKLEGTGVLVNCANPGMSRTNLGRDAGAVSRMFFKIFGKNPAKGAQTMIYLASAPDLTTSGEYFEKKKEMKINPETYDMDVANKLWDISKTYVGL